MLTLRLFRRSGAVVPNPDPNGGLWIVDRSGGARKVNIPEDELAVQVWWCDGAMMAPDFDTGVMSG